ncbi:MAG: hypothetical protein LUQ65_00150 [Candidatus Helarchaeota archaeon]|nr:hypothetical protein [Candidatus Helarchaeota archaeon]
MDLSKSSNVFPIQITIIGIDETIEGELVRTKAPRIVERILSLLPITGRVSKQKAQLNLSINIKKGAEKPSKVAKKSDIAYWPKGDAFSIFLADTEPYGEINVIGTITSNLNALSNLKLGSTLKIALKQV